eukprot:225526_1
MTPLLCILSLLFYTAYTQCSNGHASSGQSLLFSVSVNGIHVNKLGVSDYLSTVEAAAKKIAPSSGRMQMNIFGGPITGSNTATKMNMGTNAWSTLQSSIQGLATSINWDKSVSQTFHWGNVVSEAVDLANVVSFSGQKYHVVFAAGIPLSTWGTSTTADNFDNPCGQSITAKTKNIQQFVVLIGTQGTNYFKEYYSCMVEDPVNDIIEIDPSSPSTGLSKLESRVCKTFGVDIKITEVNPVSGAYQPFIEVLNRGAPTRIQANWGGQATAVPSGLIATGSYYVSYVPADGRNGWIASAFSGPVADSVYHTTMGTQVLLSGASGQQTGRSFELRAVGYNNDYGMNWRVSCGSNINGSPGSAPVACTELDSSCDTSDCNANGASGTTCVNKGAVTNSLCQCPTDYLEDINTCIGMVTPSSCSAYVLADEVMGKDFVYFVFPRAQFDGAVEYVIKYPGPSQEVSVNTGIPGTAQLSFHSSIKTGTQAQITVTTTYTSPIRGTSVSKDSTMTCSISTARPTASPSQPPTNKPSAQPTGSPTPPPTNDSPGVYLVDLCSPTRCECFENVKACCFPFAPTGGSPETLTTGTIPVKGCHNIFQKIQIEKDDTSDGKTQVITFEKYGGDARTEIQYQITYHGQINKTLFTNLSDWTDWYGTSRRLQDADTPSPTTKWSNTLNLLMTPPGEDVVTTGTLVIEDGGDQAELELQIDVESLKCEQGGECPTTYDECSSQGLGYQIEILSCASDGQTGCQAMYPYVAWLLVHRSNQGCMIAFGIGNDEAPLPDWLWWVLLALLIFLLCLCWLVYRYWWKQKKQSTELGDAVDELDQQQADNEQGFGKDLDVGDVAFNPMATGVPGMNRPADAFGNELHQRQLEQQNDMVDVQAEIFQVRQDYGQVATGPRGNRNQGY